MSTRATKNDGNILSSNATVFEERFRSLVLGIGNTLVGHYSKQSRCTVRQAWVTFTQARLRWT